MQTQINEIKNAVMDSTTGVFGTMADFWPNILGAIFLVIIGFILGWIVEKAIVKSAKKIKLTIISEKIGLDRLLKKANIKSSVSVLVGKLLKGYIIFMFVMAAANILQLHPIADFINTIIAYIPNVIIALGIILVGIRFGETTSAIIETTLNVAESSTAKVVGSIAKYALIFFAAMAALAQLEIANEIVMTLFIGFVSMIALGGGLAFGLGGKDLVKDLLEDLRKVKK